MTTSAATTKAPKGVLVDLTRCIGCRGCQVSCKSWNERPARPTVLRGNFTNPAELSDVTYTNVRFEERETPGRGPAWYFVKDQCLHCKDPSCASVCPVGALVKTPEGPVAYHFERCMGCRYCMVACPFHVPKYEWNSLSPWVRKCTFCSERVADGRIPACVKSCATGAMYFDDRDKVVAEAERRLREKPGRYVDHIFGKTEAGGTSWVYLSAVPFDQIGFVTKVPDIPLPTLTWASLAKIPYAVGGLVTVLSLVAWFRNRGDAGPGEKGAEKGKED